jgi:O-antigen ligase
MYSLNSQSIIFLTLSWILLGDFKNRLGNLKRMLIPFLLVSSPFWLSLIKFFYTDDISLTVKLLVKNIPFLILPLIIFSTITYKGVLEEILGYFSISVLIASVFGLMKSIYFKIANLGTFFYYTEFSKVLDKHTTYFALFVLIAISFFLYNVIKLKKIKTTFSILAVSFLLLILYLLSSRISIIVLVIILVIFFYQIKSQINLYHRMALISILVLLGGVFFISPNFQERSARSSEFGVQTPRMETRLVHWKAVLNTFKNDYILLGNKNGDVHKNLYQEYKKIGFESGYKNKYNAHNQYLENWLHFGLFGTLLLVLTLVFCIKNLQKSKSTMSLIIVSCFCIFMITESILVRHSGIVLFSGLISLVFKTASLKGSDND